MSDKFMAYIIAKNKYKKLKKFPEIKEKPAEKNINFEYIDSISYNIIESMTMFKNKEINYNKLNLTILGNLSLLLAKGEFDQKKNKKNKNKSRNKNNKNKKECSIDNFGIYFPTERIPFLSETKDNNSENKKIIKRTNCKLPFSHECIKTFFPLGSNFLNIEYFNEPKYNKGDRSIINETSYDKELKEKNANSYYQDSNDNSISLISEESLSNIDLFNNNNKESNDNNNKNVIKNLKRFKHYKELIDYIECPLISKKHFNNKYNSFIKLLDSFNDLDEYNEMKNNNLNENLDLNEEIDIDNYKSAIIDNFEIINNIHNINIDIKNKNNYFINNKKNI
jgi:hypothetical protein